MVFRGGVLMVCLLDREIAAPTRWRLPSCSRPSRTLRAPACRARRSGRKDGGDRTEGWRAGHAAPRRHILMDFPLPLPPRCRESWKRKRAVGAMSRRRLWLYSRLIVARALSATGEAITLVGLAEAAGGGKGGEALVEGGGADAAARAQLGEWQRAVDVGECGSDALVDGTGSRRLRGSRFDDLERESVGAPSEFERHARHGRSGAVLDGQGDIAVFAGVAVAAEVEVGIAPGMELGGASQGLTGADVAGALPGVVDDDDGDGVTALQLAQIGEQRGHFAAGVLIDAM